MKRIDEWWKYELEPEMIINKEMKLPTPRSLGSDTEEVFEQFEEEERIRREQMKKYVRMNRAAIIKAKNSP